VPLIIFLKRIGFTHNPRKTDFAGRRGVEPQVPAVVIIISILVGFVVLYALSGIVLAATRANAGARRNRGNLLKECTRVESHPSPLIPSKAGVSHARNRDH